MRLSPYTVALGVAVAVLILGVASASAQTQPQEGWGGGYVSGYVYGYTMYNELIPLNWVQVTAKSNQYAFTTSSYASGRYEMYLPAGTFNMSVSPPGYKSYSMMITVSNGASLRNINFYLEQSQLPIPEFPAQTLTAIMIVALAAALLAKRATKRKH